MKQTVVITGGSRGIGAATAKLAASRGHNICFAYQSDDDAAEQIVIACKQVGGNALAVKADISTVAGAAKLFATCDEHFGSPTTLVNNAGIIGQRTSVSGLTPEALRRTFEVNVFGAVYCIQEAIRRMSTRNNGGGGTIINISSMASRLGSPGEYVHYAASKGALESLTIGLAKELGPDGIRVNAIRSGTIDTDMHVREGNPDRPAMVAASAPLGRVGTVEEIANAILWLASAEATYTSGALLDVTGGL